MAKTDIPWVGHSINPVKAKGGGWHCTKVSPGCQNCYAETINNRFGNGQPFDDKPVEYVLDLSCFDKLPKRKSTTVFVQDMSDLFHEDVPDVFINQIFDYMGRRYSQHKYLLLTKRPVRAKEWLIKAYNENAPYPNIALGVTVENYAYTWRIEELKKIPAAMKFISFEPLLMRPDEIPITLLNGIDWAIWGAETGKEKRPCFVEWIEAGMHLCNWAGISCFVKQINVNGRISHDPEYWPESVRVRQLPEGWKP